MQILKLWWIGVESEALLNLVRMNHFSMGLVTGLAKIIGSMQQKLDAGNGVYNEIQIVMQELWRLL